jgi:hypothetical protein
MRVSKVRVLRDKPECFRDELTCPDCGYCLDPIPELIDHGPPLWVEISMDFPGNARYRQWGPSIPSLACQVFGWSEFIYMVPRDFQNWIEQQRPDDWERLTRDDVEQLLQTAIQQRNDEQVDAFAHQQVRGVFGVPAEASATWKGDSTSTWASANPVSQPPAKDGSGMRRAIDCLGRSCKSFGQLRTVLKNHPEIYTEQPLTKKGKPNPRRLRVDADDWEEYERRQAGKQQEGATQDPLDQEAETVDAVLEFERRKAEVRQEKEKKWQQK